MRCLVWVSVLVFVFCGYWLKIYKGYHKMSTMTSAYTEFDWLSCQQLHIFCSQNTYIVNGIYTVLNTSVNSLTLRYLFKQLGRQTLNNSLDFWTFRKITYCIILTLFGPIRVLSAEPWKNLTFFPFPQFSHICWEAELSSWDISMKVGSQNYSVKRSPLECFNSPSTS